MSRFADWRRFRLLRSLVTRFRDPARRPQVIRHLVVALILLLVLPKVGASVYHLVRGDGEEEPVPAVDVVVATPSVFEETLRAAGTIRANQEVNLTAEASGIVRALRIDEGSPVEAGALLVKINDNDLQAQLRGVEYQLGVMRQAAARQEQLVEEGGTTREAYERTLIQVNELLAARENLVAQIERTEVTAPFDGEVGLTYVHVGSYITPSTRIATLQDVNTVRLDFSVPERYARLVGPGSTIRFTVQGVDSVFTGTVYAVEPQIDPRTRTLQVRATSENPDGLLKPGAFASIELILASSDDAILLPSMAVRPGQDEPRVMVYRDGVAAERVVRTGARTADEVQVVGGIAPGDTVIINGLHRLADGVPVRIRGSGPAIDGTD